MDPFPVTLRKEFFLNKGIFTSWHKNFGNPRVLAKNAAFIISFHCLV